MLCTIPVCGGAPGAAGRQEQDSVHGTLWKILSWATDDEHIAFYDNALYYVVGYDYFGEYLLEDSFYREYGGFAVGSGVVPERLINYPGDVVVRGIVFPGLKIGWGYALPLPAPALLVLRATGWQPGQE